jgi:hypothetical protein
MGVAPNQLLGIVEHLGSTAIYSGNLKTFAL